MKKALLVLSAIGVFLGGCVWAQTHLYEVPILMYHRVEASEPSSGVQVHPLNFETQMEFLKVHRYHVLSLEDLVRELKSGKKPSAKTVVITFDDGSLDNFKNAFPVLRKMGFPATIFMITSNIGKAGWLSEEDLKIMDEGGVHIGSHTVNHAFLPEVPLNTVKDELAGSKKALETLLGHPIPMFSYPAGGVTPEIAALVRETGYEGAVTTNYRAERNDPYALRRIKVGNSSGNLFNFWLKTSGYYHLGKKRVSYSGHEDD